jgi:ribonuclease Y
MDVPLSGAVAAVATAALTSSAIARRVALRRAGLSAARLQRWLEQTDERDERLTQREGTLDAVLRGIEERESQLAAREADLQCRRALVDDLVAEQTAKLEHLAGFSADSARDALFAREEAEARRRGRQIAAELADRARAEAERRAQDIIATAVQRLALSVTAPATTVSVPVPDSAMKARIIGRDGRNIRAFEEQTGVNLVVDEAPDTVVLSCFDPHRREVARLALAELIEQGRIYPSTIEIEVARAAERAEEAAMRAAEEATRSARVDDLHPELLRLLADLHFRMSFGQNVLQHSIEVAHLAALMAVELGLDPDIARRAGLLHDIGKARSQLDEGSHAQVGAEMAARYGEGGRVCHAIEAHHRQVEPRTVEAVLLQAADAASQARPGGRREPLDQYMTRLRRIEELCQDFPGVQRVHAMQAGAEVRIMVAPEQVNDDEARLLVRRIAQRLEGELGHPGQITVTVVREMRATQSIH